ncbi:calcium-binding protein [Mesobacterium pallidum]|uniref:calcium-binding protein n=1 Tax=Mesobacterium pallidum TaxID=2872037 RepID=UPI001EE2826F|nr:calcium-binding protein [Mesobacterium pallidum]
MVTIARLYDGEGHEWDFLTDGRIYDGWLDAFDGGMVLSGFDDADGRASWSMDGREFSLSGSYSDGKHTVATQRDIYVPEGAAFARWHDSFTNTGPKAITLQVTYLNSLGSDLLTNVLETSSGDNRLTSADTYFISDDSILGLVGFDATVAEAWGDGSHLPTSATIGAYGTPDSDNPTITFSLDIAAGETVSLLMFATQSTSWAEARVDTLHMRDPGVTWLAGLNEAERARIVNYDLAPDPVAPLVEIRDMGLTYDFAASGLADYNYTLDRSVDHLAWRTSGGHRLTVYGEDFAFDWALRPVAGRITRVALDLGDNDHRATPDLTISGLDLALTELDLSFGSRGNDAFWRQVLGGATAWQVAAGGAANTFAGDVSGAALGNDTMTGAEAPGLVLVGDLARLSGAATAGHDHLFGPAARLVGDVDRLEATGDLVAGHDVLTGSDAADRLVGDVELLVAGARVTGGSDTLLGGAGNDTLLGDLGTWGAAPGVTGGNDLIDGQDGADYAEGQGGDDTLLGGKGADTLLGGSGHDVLKGQQKADLLDGGDGNDSILGGYGADTATGGAGSDTLDGGDGLDQLSGGAGADLLTGGKHGDMLYGEAGNDILRGGLGHDGLWGGLDHDSLYGWSGNDQIWCEDGDDIADGGEGYDTLGGATGDDTLSGGDNGDLIWGGDGNDSLSGQSGNDVIDGGAGDDWIAGGNHADTIWGSTGADTIYGGAGNDLLAGGGQDDQVFGGDGADTIEGQWGNDVMQGGDGADLFLFSGSSGQDTIGDFQNGTDRLQLNGFSWGDVTVTALGTSRLVEWGANSVLLDGTGGVIDAADFLFA